MVQVKTRELAHENDGDPHYWVNYDWEPVDEETGKLLDEAEEHGIETMDGNKSMKKKDGSDTVRLINYK